MSEKNVIVRNGVEIDTTVASQIISKILFDENVNLRTKDKGDADMVNQHVRTIKEAVHAYK